MKKILFILALCLGLVSNAHAQVQSFDIKNISDPQIVGEPFNVQITARDENGLIDPSFNGTVNLSGWRQTGNRPTIKITECSLDAPDFIEIQNVAGRSVDVTGWTVALSNSYSDINSVNTIVWELAGSMTSGSVQYRTDSISDNYWGNNILWNPGGTYNGWAMIVDAGGTLVDFVAWGWSASDISGMSVVVNSFTVTIGDQFTSDGVVLTGTGSIQRQGDQDHNEEWDFSWSPISKGTLNDGINKVFVDIARVDINTSVSGAFVNGTWKGELTIDAAAQDFFLYARDGSGNAGASNTFDALRLIIRGVYPTLGGMDENLDVTVNGKGFDTATKTSMALDVGNRRAILASILTPYDGELNGAVDVKVLGNWAYVANTVSGVQIIDIDPQSPDHMKIVDVIDTGSNCAGGLDGAGDYLYVCGSDGLQVVDISDPENRLIVGSVWFTGSVDCLENSGSLNEVVYNDGYAYVANGSYGLRIIDVSNPLSPWTYLTVPMPDEAYDVDVMGDYAYVAAKSGFYVVDLNSGTIIGFWEETSVNGVAVFGDYAFLACGEYLVVMDISDPTTPDYISVLIAPGGEAIDVDVVGDYAYVADLGSLLVIDISDPAAPVFSGAVDTPGYAHRLEVVGGRTYLADFSSVLVIDTSDLESLQFYLGLRTTERETEDVAIKGDLAYVPVGFDGIQVFDTTNPADPQPTELLYYGSRVNTIEIRSDYAYIGTVPGLKVIDLRTHLEIGSVTVDPGVSVRDIKIAGAYAYVLTGNDGDLRVIDISDPETPTLVGTTAYMPGSNQGNAVAVAGGYAYAITQDYFTVIDINPISSTYLTRIADVPRSAGLSGLLTDVAVDGDYAFVTGTSGGFHAIDINPSSPNYLSVVGTLETSGYARAVNIVDGYAYVSCENVGVLVVDLSDPADLQVIASISTVFNPGKTQVANDILYAAVSIGFLTAPVPKVIDPNSVASDTEMSVTLPAPTVPGHYTLKAFNAGNDSYELPGAVSFTDDSQILYSKAIIVAGSGPDAPGFIWDETKACANKAYDVLINQGFDHESILYYSAEVGNDKVDGPPLQIYMDYGINIWANDASDVILYFVGHGEPDNFILYANDTYAEKLSAVELDGWLDDLQQSISGPVTLVYDACNAGSFVSRLLPPIGKERYVITSTSASEPAYFLDDGSESFSYRFWDHILQNEGNLGVAYTNARTAMQNFQTALINSNGDRLANEAVDVELAESQVVRRGVATYLGTQPRIGAVVGDQTLSSSDTATLWVDGVGDADKVWARIMAPDVNPDSTGIPISELPVVELTDPEGDGQYEGVYSGFTVAGTYFVSLYAVGSRDVFSYVTGTTATQTIYSALKHTSVTRNNGTAGIEMDNYETDDALAMARVIVLNDSTPQPHNIHAVGDQDWVKFYAQAGHTYKIKAGNPSPLFDAIVDIFDAQGTSQLSNPGNEKLAGEEEAIDWTCPQEGFYFVQISNAAGNSFYGEGVKYELAVYDPIGSIPGELVGQITDSWGVAIGDAVIHSSIGEFTTISYPNGYYILVLPSGSHTISIDAAGYYPRSESGVAVLSEARTTKDFSLILVDGVLGGDVDNSGAVDLGDVVLTLQIMAGFAPADIHYAADINDDNQLGLAEAVYILQKLSGAR